MTYDLSILIPARNEMFLSRTVEDILKNIRGRTEIIVVLDGQWSDPAIQDDERVTILYFGKSIGQRAATNQACRLSNAKYVMKIDAHCAVDEGFDVKMITAMKDDYTMLPTMYNLHAFDWVCKKCGNRWYQGITPTKCQLTGEKRGDNPDCDGSEFYRDIIWKRRDSRKSYFYRFDKNLHFQYWGEFGKRPEAQGDIVPTLSAQGSCFMLTRSKYWELDICDELHGSWGQQGTEVACKTWLSGGKLVTNKETWYAHMFRTQGGDFGFPYPLSGHQVDQARQYSKDLWLGHKWKKAKYTLNWLLNKFSPVPDWHTDEIPVSKGIIYYTDNQLNLKIAHAVQRQLRQIGLPITSSSLKPMNFGKNIYLPLKRGYLAMAKQILAALEASTTDIVFFCEHDVLYHPSHFEFLPPNRNIYYYNTNVWRVRTGDGLALWTDNLRQLSGLCAYRELAIRHFKERVKRLEDKIRSVDEEEFNRYVRAVGFEPGTHNRDERIDDFKAESWQSSMPNIDIRHKATLTSSRWRKEQYRNTKYTEGWTEKHILDLQGWDSRKLSFIIGLQ